MVDSPAAIVSRPDSMPALAGVERRGQRVDGVDQRPGQLVERLALRREGDLRPPALEQLGPELELQGLDLQRDRGLAEHRLLGSPRDASGLGREAEAAQPAEPVAVALLGVVQLGHERRSFADPRPGRISVNH